MHFTPLVFKFRLDCENTIQAIQEKYSQGRELLGVSPYSKYILKSLHINHGQIQKFITVMDIVLLLHNSISKQHLPQYYIYSTNNHITESYSKCIKDMQQLL